MTFCNLNIFQLIIMYILWCSVVRMSPRGSIQTALTSLQASLLSDNNRMFQTHPQNPLFFAQIMKLATMLGIQGGRKQAHVFKRGYEIRNRSFPLKNGNNFSQLKVLLARLGVLRKSLSKIGLSIYTVFLVFYHFCCSGGKRQLNSVVELTLISIY